MATSAAKIYWDALYKNPSLKWNLTLKSLLKLSLVLPVLETMDAGERERHQKVWFTSLGKWCVAEFRFQKDDTYNLPGVLQVLDEIVCYVCYNGTKVSNIEALWIFFKRYAYPWRYLGLIHGWARPVPGLCIINNFVLKLFLWNIGAFIYNNKSKWLSLNNLQAFANVYMIKVSL